MANNIMLNLRRTTSNVIINHVQRRHMPVNVPPTATGKRRFRLAVETDPHKLVNYCCGLNYHRDEPPIKLKPDSEYPDWLWTLRLEAKPNSWDMEPNTKEYYLRLREEQIDLNYLAKTTAEKPKKVVGKVLKSQEEYIKRLRFAALAHMEDDVGLQMNSLESDWRSIGEKKIDKRHYYMPIKEGKVVYMDKPPVELPKKNFRYDYESTFSTGMHIDKPPSNRLQAIQDSKRRHRYTGT